MDAGALCLSSSEFDPSASQNLEVSGGHEDRHKAPYHLLIHPLSLQDGGGVSHHTPIRFSEFIMVDE